MRTFFAVLFCSFLTTVVASEPVQPDVVRASGAYAVCDLQLSSDDPEEFAGRRVLINLRDGIAVNGVVLGFGSETTDVSTLTYDGATLQGTIQGRQWGGQAGDFAYTIEVTISSGACSGSWTGSADEDSGGGSLSGRLYDESAWASRLDVADADAWPSYRGPNGSLIGTANGRVLVDDLARMRLAWKAEIQLPGMPGNTGGFGRKTLDTPFKPLCGGGASPVVADGKVVVSYYRPSGDVYDAEAYDRLVAEYGADCPNLEKAKVGADDIVSCFDADTGARLWTTRFPGSGLNFQEHKESPNNLTPVIGDGKVFAVGTTARVYCLDLADGSLLWQDNLGYRHQELHQSLLDGLANEEYQGTKHGNRTFGCSPIYVDGAFVMPDMSGNLRAYEAGDGTLRWTAVGITDREDDPTVWHDDGDAFIITSNDAVSCLDPDDGEILWSLPVRPHTTYSSPNVVGDIMVLITAPTDTGEQEVQCHRLTRTGPTRLWRLPLGTEFSHAPMPLIHDGRVYLGGSGFVRAYDLTTGALLAESEGRGPGNAGHLFMVDGRVVVSEDGKHGDVRLDLVDARGGDLLHTGAQPWSPSHPDSTSYHHYLVFPLVDGRLFMRGEDGLYCWDLRRATAPVISPAGGAFTTAQTVVIDAPDADAIRYTLDGSQPGPGSLLYTGPFTVDDSLAVKAIAYRDAHDASAITTAFFYFGNETAASPPEFNPPGGIYDNEVDLHLSTPTRYASIFYTLDGSEPTTASPRYEGPIAITADTEVRAITITDYEHLDPSNVATAAYRIQRRPFLEADGQVSLEAEHFFSQRQNTESTWVVSTAFADSSNGAAVTSQEDAGVKITGLDGPRLSYPVQVATAGSYYVWARWSGASSSSDSFHFGVDDTKLGEFANRTGAWQWQRLGDDSPTTLDLSAGDDVDLHVWMREDGTRIDKLLLTTDPDFVPAGAGPTESARAPARTLRTIRMRTVPDAEWSIEPVAPSQRTEGGFAIFGELEAAASHLLRALVVPSITN